MDDGHRRTQSPFFGAVKKATKCVQDLVKKTVETMRRKKRTFCTARNFFFLTFCRFQS